MIRNWAYLVIGAAATVWNAAYCLSFFAQDTPLGPGTAELPLTIRGFLAMATIAGVTGGLALALQRRWAATLLWISWLGVFMTGGWAEGLYSGRLNGTAIQLLLASAFGIAAQLLAWQKRAARIPLGEAASSASHPKQT